ncbi:Short-chain dehydrogenase/reductase SDR [Macrophomina phaseolina MS6]|uniref:Short-chain dehydrogenase/reductase SDR n=1 Tax=Macrophomina phaseolina (strain MS6) TaxID=1126212 RepID=K2RD30_MACPH|nr:Short-chain dehydrogenase/reductase SDR [Macrophomina phaseolina MS6]
MAALPTYTKTFHTTTYPSISPTRPELSLAGKTILITGGGSGIGAAIAHAYAQAGARNILLMGRRLGRLEAVQTSIASSHPRTAVALHAGDVTNPADVAAAFAALTAAFGPSTTLDALVANAGYLETPRTVDAADEQDWWRAYEVNVKSLFLLARGFVRHATKPGAVFVNVSTMAAHAGAFPEFSGYAGSKLAAAKVVEVMQAEKGGEGLRFVNAHPGVIETDIPEAEFLKGKFVWVNWDVDELKARQQEIASGNELTVGLLGWA